MTDITDEDRERAIKFMETAMRNWRTVRCNRDELNDFALELSRFIIAAEARGAERERARVVSYLRTQQAWHNDHDDGLSGFDGIAQGYGEAADGIEEGDHLPARHADQGEG